MQESHQIKQANRPTMTIHVPTGYAFRGETTTGVRAHEKVFPNDPCPCGSTKKAKKCCFKTSKVIPSK